MPQFLVVKLDGVMQGWGGHTYEDWRPTELFPTRSGLLGLLGACLGIDRQDIERLNALAESVRFTVWTDYRVEGADKKPIASVRLCDYHTIEYARKCDGSENKNPVQSYRWYLFDALFTVVMEATTDAKVTLNEIAEHLKKPVYTPFLGRRSCPISRPLLEPGLSEPFEATNVQEAIARSGFGGSVIYTESQEWLSDNRLRMRDVPLYGRNRRFTTREVYIHPVKEVNNVS